MEGFDPCLPLNPLHPRADGDAMAAGFKKQNPFSKPTRMSALLSLQLLISKKTEMRPLPQTRRIEA
jgi:hypothetical protein